MNLSSSAKKTLRFAVAGLLVMGGIATMSLGAGPAAAEEGRVCSGTVLNTSLEFTGNPHGGWGRPKFVTCNNGDNWLEYVPIQFAPPGPYGSSAECSTATVAGGLDTPYAINHPSQDGDAIVFIELCYDGTHNVTYVSTNDVAVDPACPGAQDFCTP